MNTSPTDVKLSIRGLGKKYGPVIALHPTDVEVREGEFLTLLGPSGSGKTTLLMMVAGLLKADSGTLLIDGHDATHAPPWERGIGMVFQNYALFPHLTVFENIAFPLRMRKVPEAEIKREVARVLDIVQLGHTAQRLPRGLSGGQQQRIALARAFVFKPGIILMDEPLGALDKKLRDQLQIEIKHIHRSLNTTILYVTHDQGEALTMSDRICLMNNGRIEQLATPQDLYFRPATVFAADFLGESNFIPGTVAEIGDGMAAVATASGRVLRGIAATALKPGMPAKVMVRPERLRFATSAPEDCNSLPATIRESIFVGGFTRHFAASDDGAELTSQQLTGEAAGLAPGEAALAVWPAQSSVVLEAGGV